MKLYVLDNENWPVKVKTIREWGEWFENTTNRVVGYTEITSEVHVSTVFLGIDHRHISSGPPVLFETMVFGGEHNELQQRYVSWDDAVTGHAAAVRKLRSRMRVRS